MSEETKHNFPFFPLNLIVMPGEIQPLHIFEPRYKQLIHDIQTYGEHFGIPFMLNNKICKLGSCVKLYKILSETSTGEMDILVKGVSIISIESMEDTLGEKLYSGGSVKILKELNKTPSTELSNEFKNYQAQLAKINKIEDNSEKTNESLNVLDIAGQLPLEIEEKFNFLILNCPIKRETFLLNKIKFLHMINQKLEQLGYRFFLN